MSAEPLWGRLCCSEDRTQHFWGIQVLSEGTTRGSPLSRVLFRLLLDCLHNVLKAVPGNYAPSLATYRFNAASRNWKMSKTVPLLLYKMTLPY